MNPVTTQSSPFGAMRSRIVPEIITIAASTGGPEALQHLLPQLPPDLPVAVIIVQHMPPGFTGPLAKRLNTISGIEVREAENGDLVQAGKVYIAPAGQHITVERHGTNRELKTKICLSQHPLETLHRPSADVMMASVAELFGKYCCGVILTGMGNDGLEGMTAIHKAGGITIGQDKASSTVYGMPRVCAESGILQWVVSLSQMKTQILQAVGYTEKPERNFCAKSLHP
jgi:two-component system chemotaxis response regulator CheB